MLSESRTKAYRVLLVEDDVYDAELIERELDRASLGSTFELVQEKVAFTAALEREPDVVLIDYHLPRFDLFEAMRIAGNHGNDVPFIVVTGYVGEELAAECIKRGAVDYVLKDSLHRLPQAVIGAVQRRDLERANEAALIELDQAQIALQASEERFRSLVQNSRDVIAIIDTDGVVGYVSPAVEAITGHRPDELVGTSASDLLHPEDRDRAVAAFLRALDESTRPTPVEFRTARKDGGWVWVEARATNQVANPSIAGIVLNVHDATDRKIATDRLLESQGLLAQAEAMSHVGSFSWDRETNLVRWSDEMFRIFGYEPGSFEPSYDFVLDAVGPAGRSSVMESVERCERLGSSSLEFGVNRPDGSVRWVSSNLRKAEDGTLIVGTVRDVTEARAAVKEREEMERALRWSERLFRGAFEGANTGMVLMDTNGAYLDVNAVFCGMVGYTKVELLGMSWKDITHPDDLARNLMEAQAVLDGSNEAFLQKRYVHRDGRIVWVEVADAVIRDSDGTPLYFVTQCQDITERMATEAALKANQRLLQEVMDNSPAVIAIKKLDGTYSMVNEKFCEIFGVTQADVIGRTSDDLMPGDLSRKSADEDASVFMTRQAMMRETEVDHADGSRHTYGVLKFPLIDESDDVHALCVISTDITEQVAAAKLLKESEENFKVLFMGNPAPMWVYAAESHRFLAVNEAACEKYGYSEKEFLGLTSDAVTESTDFESDQSSVVQGMRSVRHRAKTGTLEVEVRSLPLVFSDIPSTLEVIQDVTERNEAERERVRLQEQLRQAQKLEAVGQLAGGVAHDFNNLLAVVINYGRMLIDDTPADDPRVEDLEEIVRAGELGASLTRQLLMFSRREVANPIVVDVNQIIHGMEKMLSRTIRESIELTVEPAEEVWPIVADAGHIEQVLMNLAVNSRDAMPSGGRLSIKTSNVVIDEVRASMVDLAPGDYVLITVSDNGDGMTPAVMDRIFEPFFTTKGRSQGTGLGLATVYGIVKQSNGAIECDSEVDQGTTFRLYFPRSETERISGALDVDGDVPSGNGETILLVEDDAAVREMTVRMLVRGGYEVWSAGSGVEARALLRETQEQPHVLVTDLIMPGGMSGKEVAQELGLPTIFMSGYTDNIIAQPDGLQEGERFLQKPFPSEALLQLVADVLRESESSPTEDQAC